MLDSLNSLNFNTRCARLDYLFSVEPDHVEGSSLYPSMKKLYWDNPEDTNADLDQRFFSGCVANAPLDSVVQKARFRWVVGPTSLTPFPSTFFTSLEVTPLESFPPGFIDPAQVNVTTSSFLSSLCLSFYLSLSLFSLSFIAHFFPSLSFSLFSDCECEYVNIQL